jgi:hypothetical protein
MNSRDPFEERLRRTPFRQPPPALRAPVLQAGQTPPAPASNAAPSSLWIWITNCLWPHPVAWGTLGLAWLVILALSLASVDGPDAGAPRRPQSVVAPALTAALRQQRAMLQTLLQDSTSVTLVPEPGPGAQLWQPEDSRKLALA